MANAQTMDVEVAYARPDEQRILSLAVKHDCTIQQAITQSGILTRYPELDLQRNKVGIFGKQHPLTMRLQPGDRVEIYRPLLADPKEARKKRASRRQRT